MVTRTLHVEAMIRRGDFRLEVAVDISPGETLGVIGPNGAGKTTLLRAIAGLTPLDEGIVSFAGEPWDDPSNGIFVDPTSRRCPVVFQDYRLFPHLSVLDNVAYAERVRGRSRREARDLAHATLARLGLAALANRRPRELSGGQAQRVAVARALATGPHALLLDEPLAALDARTKQEIRLELKQTLAGFDGPVLFLTHDPLEAMTLTDRLLVLEHGRVVQLAPPREVAARPATDYIAHLVGINLYAGTLTAPGVVALDEGGTLTTTSVTAGPTASGAALVTTGDRALVALSPTAISVHHNKPEGVSARNVWPATIRGLEQLRDRIRLDLDGEPPAIADITPTALAQLGLDVGDRVWLSAKATELTAYAAPVQG